MRHLDVLQVRREMVRYAHALHQQGWVANHDGNLSARLGKNRFLATPTARSKEDISAKSLLETNDQGERIAGTSRRFSEIHLHLEIYRRRADVDAVIHAHSPAATAIASSGPAGHHLLSNLFIAEAVVSLGPEIPVVPFAAPGQAAVEALAPFTQRADVILLENHGVLAWGKDIEQAYLRLELCEHLANIALRAAAIGGVKPLPREVVLRLLTARAQAGLGAVADRAVELYNSPPPR